MFVKTLYFWYYNEFMPKKNKTSQDFKDLRSYFADLHWWSDGFGSFQAYRYLLWLYGFQEEIGISEAAESV